MAPPIPSSDAPNQRFNILSRDISNEGAATVSNKGGPDQMPGSFGPDISASYYPPFINGEFIDLTTPDIEVKISSLVLNVATFAAKSALTGAGIVAAYGIQKLGESEIPDRVSEWLQAASDAAEDIVAEIDWVQIPIEVAKWISDNPKLAKGLGCVAATGALVYVPSRMPSLVWGCGLGGKFILGIIHSNLRWRK